MQTRTVLGSVRWGLFLVMLGLVFGFGLGVSFGVAEDAYKDYIAHGISAYPEHHDEKSVDKIWRYAQRAHFHATGIAAFSLGLVLLTALSSLQPGLKAMTAISIGLGGLYPLSWFSMFVLAPSIGREAAHEHLSTELFTYIGVGGLALGILILSINLFLGRLSDHR